MKRTAEIDLDILHSTTISTCASSSSLLTNFSYSYFYISIHLCYSSSIPIHPFLSFYSYGTISSTVESAIVVSTCNLFFFLYPSSLSRIVEIVEVLTVIRMMGMMVVRTCSVLHSVWQCLVYEYMYGYI